MDAKLDKIGKQMEDKLIRVYENVGPLREYKLGEETKQGLASFPEVQKRKFKTVDVDMQAQNKDIKDTVEMEEWRTEVQEILTALLEQQIKLPDKVSERSRKETWLFNMWTS